MATCATRPLLLMQSCRTPLRLSNGLRCAACARPRNPSPGSAAPSSRRPLSSTRALRSQQGGRFRFNVAASYIAKDRPYDPSTHVFHFNPHNRLQPPKKKSRHLRPDSGQDAFFVSRVDGTGGVALGVADGVGGWMDSGVDPADFSHGLCDYMAAAAHEQPTAVPASRGGETGEVVRRAHPLTARQLMQIGYDAVCADPAIPAGGSTAVVGLLEPDGTLEVANLGDSGVIHLRLNAVHACSEPQTHAFNTPFQLSIVPPSIMLRMAAFGGAHLSDLPRDAEVARHRLRHGDVLVFASDGVWDNLFNQDILRIVSAAMRRAGAWVDSGAGTRVAPDLAPQTTVPDAVDGGAGKHAPIRTLQSAIATGITSAAKAASVNTKLDGPFAKEVKKHYPLESWHGGKVDDICVVAVVVSETPADPPKSKL